MKVYITHCCAKKNDSLRSTGKRVTPDKLYTARPTKRFMEVCKERSVIWAVFSDEFGVWFSEVEHEWYEKHPNSVSEEEFIRLLHDFDTNLECFDEIWFYYNPGRFHSLYARLLAGTKLRDRVRRFTRLTQIRQGGQEMNEGRAKGMKQQDSRANYRGAKVGRTEAARILNELQICKAYGPTGKINGPNCQRFGHRDPQSCRWYWDVGELIREAESRKSGGPETIRRGEERYSLPHHEGGGRESGTDTLSKPVMTSRADLEKYFRDKYIQLECAMRKRLPSSQAGGDRRTLGNLIREAEEKQLLGRAALQEARFVNAVRIALNHPTTEKISDGRVTRAIQSARAITVELEDV